VLLFVLAFALCLLLAIKHITKHDNEQLTFIDAKAQVAFPAPEVDECDKWVNVGTTATATDDHTRLNHWQLLFINRCNIIEGTEYKEFTLTNNGSSRYIHIRICVCKLTVSHITTM